ncbi:MAG: hypothetical protein IKH41_09810 [Clostridia bacterium]|nr:hypothetical protein [Clostridia bacterium]
MIIKSAYIYGFGCLADKAFTFQPGLNCLTGESDAKKDALISFITASLFGFSENAAEDSAQQADENVHPLLPSRRSMKPFGDVPFGGELKFSERDADYILSAKWGDNSDEDIVTFIALGDASLILAPGETVCQKLWGVSPDEAAAIISMPSDGRDVSLLLKTLRDLPERNIWFEPEKTDLPQTSASSDNADRSGEGAQSGGAAAGQSDCFNGSLESLRRARLKLRNEDKTGTLDMAEAHAKDLAAELETVDNLEARISELKTAVREAEKGQTDSSQSTRNGSDTEKVRLLAGQCSDYERAESIRNDAAELVEEIKDEEKYVKRSQRPWLVLLWLLAVIDVIAIVLLTVYPVNLPVIGKVLTSLSRIRFPLLIGAAVLFVLLVIFIAAVSGSGMRRLNLLRGDMEFRKRQLSELLTAKELELIVSSAEAKESGVKEAKSRLSEAVSLIDPELRDALSDWDDPDEEGFLAAADKALSQLSERASSAGKQLSGGTVAFNAVSAKVARSQDSTDKLTALRAELAACEDLLGRMRPYPVIEEKIKALESMIARGEMQLKSLSLAEEALIRAKDASGADEADGTDGSETLSAKKLAACADGMLQKLTGGKRSGIRVSPEMVTYIDDNGSLRGLGSFSGLAAGQILLSMKLAQLSLSSSAHPSSISSANSAYGLTRFALLGSALSRFEGEDAATAFELLNAVCGSGANVQIIAEAPSGGVPGAFTIGV